MLGNKNITNSINLAHKRLNTKITNNTHTTHTKRASHTNRESHTNNICNSATAHFKLAPQFTQYTTSLASHLLQPNTAISHTIKHLFNIKKRTPLDTTIQIQTHKLGHSIDSTHKSLYDIPPYLNIFTQLLNNSEWVKSSTLTEKHTAELRTLLANKNITHSAKYEYLDTHQVGNVLGDAFYNSLMVKNNLPAEILETYTSLNLHKLLINDFTSWSVIANIEQYITHLAVVSFTFEGISYKDSIYIFINEKTTSVKLAEITKLAKDIVHRIVFYNKLLSTSKIPHRFILYLTDLEKELDDDVIKHRHFKTSHINSAVTNKQDIVIYRKQELFKSIFHELNHFHTMDFTTIPQNVISKLISTHNITPTNTYLLYECVTEALANVLNNIYLSRTLTEFKSNYAQEMKFSTIQVAKILLVCGYDDWDTFAGDSMRPNTSKHFKQDSCVFSYYILKWYILMEFPKYMITCLHLNTLKFNSENGFENLMKIFDAARTNTLFSGAIDTIIRDMKKQGKKLYKSKTGKTMRMTCL